MSTIRIPGGGFMTLADCYRYKGVTFQWHHFCGPMLLRKDGEPSKREPGAKFYAVASEWHKLPEAERETFRI